MTVKMIDVLQDYMIKDDPSGYVHPDNRPRPEDTAKGLKYNDDSIGGSLLNDITNGKEDMALCAFIDKIIERDPKAIYDLVGLIYNMDKRLNDTDNDIKTLYGLAH